MIKLTRASAAFVFGLSIATSMRAIAGGESQSEPSAHVFLPPQVAVGVNDAGPNQQVGVPSQIMILHATNTPQGGIDPAIGAMPQLKKPPFSSYNTYKLLSRTSTVLVPSKEFTTALPNGSSLNTVLKEVLPNDRFRVAANISRAQGDKVSLELTARSGETFFVAGQAYKGGILVVGITVGQGAPSPAAPPSAPPPKK